MSNYSFRTWKSTFLPNLFAWLDELLYGDHPVFIPVHFLKKKNIYMAAKDLLTEKLLYVQEFLH